MDVPPPLRVVALRPQAPEVGVLVHELTQRPVHCLQRAGRGAVVSEEPQPPSVPPPPPSPPPSPPLLLLLLLLLYSFHYYNESWMPLSSLRTTRKCTCLTCLLRTMENHHLRCIARRRKSDPCAHRPNKIPQYLLAELKCPICILGRRRSYHRCEVSKV